MTTDSPIILEAREVSRRYQQGRRSLTVLNKVSLSLRRGESLAIVGPSGSGKTTLLGLCAGLDLPDEGEISFAGQALTGRSEEERATIRREQAGFIFQSFHLLPTLTALENAAVPAELLGWSDARERAKNLLRQVGLEERLQHYPSQLSGGEQQRVAVARALVNSPSVLFADEPTGNLDTQTGETIADLLFSLNESAGTALILITHDERLAGRADRVLYLRNGEVQE
ncbi:MAG: ABC transporter ATP-binding protein [Opitutales bacterium]|nr:ABC transporter ATP-binding protein [Opitutales bacterium]MCH8541327.1 ABC transporter ATP-binding protein [Opitutales bacterium]